MKNGFNPEAFHDPFTEWLYAPIGASTTKLFMVLPNTALSRSLSLTMSTYKR